MKTRVIESKLGKILILACFGILLATMLPAAVFAGGMPQNELRTPRGSSAILGRGDYVSSNQGGLNTYYSYFIEVPPATGNLTVELFDPNIFGALDKQDGGTGNTFVKYSVIAPNGTTVATLTCGNSNTCTDNNGHTVNITDSAWQAVYTTNNPAAGHWEFRLDMSTAVTTGGDFNAFAVRATDTVTNNELNMYALSFDAPGIDATFGVTSTVTHVFPYITSGCGFNFNEFDYDSNGSISLTSSSGSYSQNITNISGDNAWGAHAVTGWTSNIAASDYGIWSANLTIGGSNIVTYYLGAATAPPTSQPQANTFRIYMPTSAGTAPVKPYMTQKLYWVSGPNPPTRNHTTGVRVEVDIWNPTPYPITFDSSHQVTLNVPGGTVLYVGNSANPTQGQVSTSTSSITAPADGFSGPLYWNPGTIAPGTGAVLYYDLNVRPTWSSGTAIAVTGTAASGNGTRVSWYDETGTGFVFGPLCELITGALPSVPTFATIKSFSAYTVGGRVVVDWETSSEVNTVGFRLYRLDAGKYVPVTNSMLPAGFSQHKKGHYRLIDNGAAPGQKITYKLEEIEMRGKTRMYGPYEITPVRNAFAQPMPTSFTKAFTDSAVAKGHTRAQKRRFVSATKSGSMIRLEVSADGVYSIDTAQIASLLGISQATVTRLLSSNQLNLTTGGKQVAYLPDAQNKRILFYGQGLKNNYTDENVYMLSLGSGRQMNRASGSAVAPGTAQGSFVSTRHYEENNYLNTLIVDDPAEDFWFWDYVIAGDPVDGSKNFNFDATNVASGQASIVLNLHGIMDGTQKALVSINGNSVGSVVWDGATAKTARLAVGSGIIKEGANTITVTGADSSVFFVQSFDVSYNRNYMAQGNGLTFTGGQTGVTTVTGFTGSDITVFDITDPLSPKVVPVTVKKGSIGLRTDGAGSTYIAAGSGAIMSASSISARNMTSLRSHANRANYLIITSEELKSAAAALAAYRSSQGYRTMIATVEDIMDEFNNGIYSPDAIKSFIRAAYTGWAVPPKYIVLAGSGSYDYNDYWGYGGQQVPPALVPSPDGLIVSDNYYVDINGDHIPDVAIGRLPASNAADLSGIINKIISYENGAAGDWTAKALLVADVPDDGGDFNKNVDAAAAIFPASYTLTKLYGSDLTSDNMYTALMASVNSGVGIIDYFGHGNVDSLSMDGILVTDNVASMTNAGKLPVITAMTCLMNNYALPGVTSLGEALVLNQTVGAASVWSATGLSDDAMAARLNNAFYSLLFAGKTNVLGDLAIDAIKKTGLDKDYGYMNDMYLLLGDPAMKVKWPAPKKK